MANERKIRKPTGRFLALHESHLISRCGSVQWRQDSVAFELASSEERHLGHLGFHQDNYLVCLGLSHQCHQLLLLERLPRKRPLITNAPQRHICWSRLEHPLFFTTKGFGNSS